MERCLPGSALTVLLVPYASLDGVCFCSFCCLVMHDTSKRLSQTLKDIYESDWQGIEDLSVIMEVSQPSLNKWQCISFQQVIKLLSPPPSQSEDLLWNDYEEKLNDQVIRTMENYTSQFPDVKVRISLCL